MCRSAEPRATLACLFSAPPRRRGGTTRLAGISQLSPPGKWACWVTSFMAEYLPRGLWEAPVAALAPLRRTQNSTQFPSFFFPSNAWSNIFFPFFLRKDVDIAVVMELCFACSVQCYWKIFFPFLYSTLLFEGGGRESLFFVHPL